jgi:hypothetical protein
MNLFHASLAAIGVVAFGFGLWAFVTHRRLVAEDILEFRYVTPADIARRSVRSAYDVEPSLN